MAYIFVGNLPPEIDDRLLLQLAAKAGSALEARVIIDKYSGCSRGFGFVTMASEEDAQKVIHMFNGVHLSGFPLVINQAQPMQREQSR